MTARLYFRTRETGAQVFREDDSGRDGRLRLEPLAVLNLRNADIRILGDRSLSDAEESEIKAWMTSRAITLASREQDQVARDIEAMHRLAGWVQSQADAAALDAVADALLIAAHDIRQAVVKRRADSLGKTTLRPD